MFEEYLKEREGFKLAKSEYGFATYKIQGDGSVYIRDLYTVKECRETGEAARLADAICESAKADGCTALIGSVSPSDPSASRNIQVLLAYGMEFLGLNTDKSLLIFRKELS